MAVFMTGFEAGDKNYYVSRGWGSNNLASITVSTTVGEVHKSLSGNGGTYAIRTANVDWISPVIGASTPSGRWLHFAYAPDTTGLSNEFSVVFMRVGGDQWAVNFIQEGTITFTRGGAGSPFVTATTVGWASRVNHWIAIFLHARNAGGSCEVWVDGQQLGTFSGDTVASTTTEDWDQFRFDNALATAFDDVIVTTAAEGRLAEHFLPGLVPDGNDSVALTPSAGTNYQNVDELPPNTTDYNSTTTSGEDTYTMTDPAWTPPSVHAVQVSLYCVREGAIADVEVVMKPTTTSFYSSNLALPAAGFYGAVENIWNTNPDTAVAWTASDVNAMKTGLRF